MPFGFGRGYGRGLGRGFGFRGDSPPWPYVGRGRGGLPRCSYPGLYEAPVYGGAWGSQYQGGYPEYGAYPYAPPASKEEEVEILKEEASSLKFHLDEIENRIKDLEGKKE